ncbi:MAG: glycosyltransferase, partial [Planctomycetes bacterium]|nr:glycosyltransferase [Planctomycetota bacterium]
MHSRPFAAPGGTAHAAPDRSPPRLAAARLRRAGRRARAGAGHGLPADGRGRGRRGLSRPPRRAPVRSAQSAALRILQLIHDWLPRHSAGSEIYTAHLAAALRAAGHQVAVFTCEEDRAAPQWSLRERAHDGVPVFEAVYNRVYADLSEQWDDPRMAEVFGGVLDRWKPDLLHVQGLQFVGGVSALRAAAARGVPVVMTLHEYWLLCPRAGLMYDPTGRACESATPADCARCVDVYPIDRLRWADARHGGHAARGQAPDQPDAA